MGSTIAMALSGRSIYLVCLASVMLNILLWMQPQVIECKCPNIDSTTREVIQQAEVVAEENEWMVLAPPESVTTVEAREAWCAERYPIEDFKYVNVTMNAAIPPFIMAVYKENDVISNMLASGVVYRSALIEMALLQYSSPGSMANKVFVDAGAHIGLFTIPALARGYEVVAFEPLDSNFKLLRHNACINGFGHQLTAYPYGLADKAGQCWIISSTSNKGDGETACTEEAKQELLTMKRNNNERYVVQGKAQYVKLDDYLPAEKAVQLMKVDVEGYEEFALSPVSAGKLFADHKRRPAVVFGEMFHSFLGRGCMVGDGAYLRTMFEREYVLTPPGATSVYSDIQAVCANPLIHILWIDRDLQGALAL